MSPRVVACAAPALAAWLGAGAALAACPSDEQVGALADAMIQRRTVPLQSTDMSGPEDAACGRDKLVARLEPTLGRRVGHKAALTNPAVQKVFGYPQPVRGVLLEHMLHRSGAVLSLQGAAPSFEADLVVEVASADINEAATPLQVLRAVKAVYPFIEVPRIVFQAPPPAVGGLNLAYSNAGAFAGVLGEPVAVSATPEGVEALADMTVTLTDGDGRPLDSAKGAAILGHPLNAVIWLAQDLKRSGAALRPGDLLSLGSFSRLHAAAPGADARARYEGLPGNPEVAVRFAP